MQASSSKSCNACRLHCPDRGVAAFGVARRFGLLLLSAAALPILWECTVISAYRQSLQCGERSHAAFRKQSAAEKTSLAPHDSKARLLLVTSSRGSWRSHVHRTYIAQRVQFFELQSGNVRGRGGRPLVLSLGGCKGGYSLSRKRVSPFYALPHGAEISRACAEQFANGFVKPFPESRARHKHRSLMRATANA